MATIDLGQRLKSEFHRLRGEASGFSEELNKSLARSEMPAHEEIARFRLDPRNYEPLTSSRPLTTILNELMGGEFFWHFPTMFREMSPSNGKGSLPYHQDFSYNAHYPSLMTVWVPLSDAGGQAPGLEVVEASLDVKFKHGPQGPWEFGAADADIAPVLKQNPVHQLMTPAGDVVLFSELTLHRTNLRPGMTETRFSMDARAVSIHSISDEVKAKRRFIRGDVAELVKLA
jgi:hypothetical protein